MRKWFYPFENVPLSPRVAAYVGLIAILSFFHGGDFPLSESSSRGLLILACIGMSVMFFALVLVCAGFIQSFSASLLRRLSNITESMWATPSVVMFLTFTIIAIHIIQANYFAPMGYRQPSFLLLLGLAMSVTLFCGAAIHYRLSVNAVLVFTLILSMMLKFVPLGYFPLTPERSDMLPAIWLSLSNFLKGQNPYAPHIINGLPTYMAYLPVTFLSYLPAAILDIDPRILNIIYDIIRDTLLLLFFIRMCPPQGKRVELALPLVCWFLFPFIHYRHELYFSAYLLVLAGSLMSLAIADRSSKHLSWLLLSTTLFGLSIATRQWSWIIFPFYSVFLVRRWARLGIACTVLALLIGAFLILPFVLANPPLFWYAVIGVYDLNLFIGLREYTVGFSYLFYELGIQRVLFPLQLALLLAIFWSALLRLFSLATFFSFSVITIIIFLFFNKQLSTYFYLTPALMILIQLLLPGAGVCLQKPSQPSERT